MGCRHSQNYGSADSEQQVATAKRKMPAKIAIVQVSYDAILLVLALCAFGIGSADTSRFFLQPPSNWQNR
jgi:hypothetical protein